MNLFKNISLKEQILNIREREFATTMRVLKSYPEDKLDMRPAEKSRSAKELIAIFVGEEYVCKAAMCNKNISTSIPKMPIDSLKDMLEMFNQVHNEVQNMIAQAADEEMERIFDFYGNPFSVLEVLWIELHDQIHHRGQFSIYLRLVGAKVPSIYGPSADEPIPA
ncbi:MAG: DinB family protein [Acidobacteriota bacterium]